MARSKAGGVAFDTCVAVFSHQSRKARRYKNIAALWKSLVAAQIYGFSEAKSLHWRRRVEGIDTVSLCTRHEMFFRSSIRSVDFRGKKQCYTIKTEGRQVTCCEDFLLLTDSGWLNIRHGLNIGYLIAFDDKKAVGAASRTNRLRYEPILSLETSNVLNCFSLDIRGKSNNFLAGGLVGHNSARPEFTLRQGK